MEIAAIAYILTILIPVNYLIAVRSIAERKRIKRIQMNIWQNARRR